MRVEDYKRSWRSRILEVAEFEFAQHGLFAVPLKHLAIKAGVRINGNGALYGHYFDGVASFKGAYLAHRSNLPVTEQRALAIEHGCLAAWQTACTDRKFDIYE